MTEPRKFIYIDPRTLAGDPYEVAAKALLQADRAVGLATTAVADAELMARNAELERQTEPDAALWPQHPQARKFSELLTRLGSVRGALKLLSPAVQWDPKHPPTE